MQVAANYSRLVQVDMHTKEIRAKGFFKQPWIEALATSKVALL